MFDFVLSVLGELDLESVNAKLQLQRPEVKIRDPKTNEITETIQSNVPDLVSLHGTLASSATLSFLFRRGQQFPGTPALTWTINCEYGELRLVSSSGLAPEYSSPEAPVTIQVNWFDDDSVEDVKWEWAKDQVELPPAARGVISTLLAFADGKESGNGWVSVEDAARRATLIERFLLEWEKNSK